MRLVATFPSGGDWLGAVARSQRAAASSVQDGVLAATIGLQTELRQHVGGRIPGLRRMSGAIRQAVYPTGGRKSLGAAGLVFVRGKSANRILQAHATGATIRSKRGRGIAVPLHSVRRNRRLATPAEYPAPLLFVPIPRGKVLGFLVVDRAGAPQGFRIRRRRAAGFTKRDRSARDAVFVVMRQAVLPKRLDPVPIGRKWAALVPQYIARSAARTSQALTIGRVGP